MSDRLIKLFTEAKEVKPKVDMEKEFVAQLFDGTKIYLVNGSNIRNDGKDVEMIGGDNYAAENDPKDPTGSTHSSCPKGELWVERMLSPTEQIWILVHEAVENLQMRHYKADYEKAHPIANSIENAVRQMAKVVGVVK
jgi:hypothetical protein